MDNKLKQLIADRREWLAQSSIQDWNDEDTISVAEKYAKAKSKLHNAASELLDALQTLQTAIGYAAENNALHVIGKQDIDLIDAAITKAVGV